VLADELSIDSFGIGKHHHADFFVSAPARRNGTILYGPYVIRRKSIPSLQGLSYAF
jgi:hypothetical protein